MSDTTIDGILNKRLMIEQPAQGFRIAVDTVLLAAAVPAIAGDKVLDMGCGVGGAMLALAQRVPRVMVTGLEIQPEMVLLCASNIERNRLDAVMHVFEEDVTKLPPEREGQFDQVMMNPPYHDEARHDASADVAKRTANTEQEGDLARWVESAANALKVGGALVMIHRGDRLDEILDLMTMAFGTVTVKPVVPREGGVAKRVIVKAVKGSKEPMVMDKPLVLHNADGGYTAEADAILRDGKAMDF